MRPEILNPLFTEITALKGVGVQLAKPLTRLGLNRVGDILFHLPTGLIDRKYVDLLDTGDIGRQIIVELTATAYQGGGSPRAPTRIITEDRAGNVAALIYFGRNSGWAKKLFPIGELRIVTGKLEQYGELLQIVHPHNVAEPGDGRAEDLREPVYPLSEGLTNARMNELTAQALARAPVLPEWIAPSLRTERGWPDWRSALTAAHVDPDNRAARDRLAYDELFASQLAWMLIRADVRRRRGRPLIGDGRLRRQLRLPFALTGAQQRTIAEIAEDVASDTPMLRLVQGDVGSGKTIVALMSLLNAVGAGAQGAFLAPTEILARQHFATLSRMVAGLPVNIALLTGREKGRAREATLMGVADGSVHILVGTHALFQDGVTYRDLGMVVVDEQHKFGVEQRLLLAQKARIRPHMLVMTATPIPRTLLLSQHGDMDVSQLDELPPGRSPVETRVIAEARIAEVIDGVARHLHSGAQAYWVCPLIEDSGKSDMAAAEARAAILTERFGPAVGIVHGRMKGPEKDKAMQAFAQGHTKLLVATTVIEVGVDVPNASLMIIESADRFGLAQLHQLRGRVGRGAAKSTCLLLRGDQISETARARLALMRETNDGFRIAEEDLALRGAGEMLGTRQSGEQNFRLTDPEQLQRLLPIARDDARLFIEGEGGLDGKRGEAARICLYLFERDAAVPLLRSG